MRKKVLGKGLSALIPQKTINILSKNLINLSLDKIKPAKYQPRQAMDQKELEELAKSIKDKGVIQPIVVRKMDDQCYEIVVGERRYQASKSLGSKEIPAIIKELDDEDAYTLAIIENLQRKDLNPMEEAQAFKHLIDEFEFSLEDVARIVVKDKTTVANALRLLKLPDNIQKAVREEKITRTQARTILSVEKIQEQEKLFWQILEEGLSVREIEKKARAVSGKKKKIDPFILDTEEKLQKLLGTKVKIYNKKNNKGRIILEYYSLKDLEKFINKIK